MMIDNHDYAKGTRVRKWLGVVLRPILRWNVRALLWLCPDTPIVANVHIGKNGSGIWLSDAIDGQIIGVRISVAENYAVYAANRSKLDFGETQ